MSTWQTFLRPGWIGNLATFAMGALYPMAFAPYNIWPIALLSIVGFLLLALQVPPADNKQGLGHSAKQVAIRSFFYGFGLYIGGTSWLYVSIHDHAHTPALLAVPMVIIFNAFFSLLWFAPLGYIYSRLQLHRYMVIAFPALWVFIEWTKTWLLTGFPWHFAGYAFIDTPLAGLAPLAGVLGISWVVTLTAGVIVYLFQMKLTPVDSSQPHSPNRRTIGLLCAVIASIWIAAGFATKLEWTQLKSDVPLRVSVIQPNISQDKKWLPEELQPTKDLFETLSMHEWSLNPRPDFILWPEAAIPQFIHKGMSFFERIEHAAIQYNSTVITGVPIAQRSSSSTDYYNGIVTVGEKRSTYKKQRLVPFGEYVPFASVIKGLIPFLDIPIESFSRGELNQAPLRAGKYLIAPFICYEIVYPSLVAQYAAGTDVLVTISNDAWFGTSAGPHQHFQMARMRALETGRSLVRGTNTGITAIIDHKGQVTSRIPQFEQGVLRGEVFARSGTTPFMVFGSAPVVWLSLILLLICSWYGRNALRSKK